MKKIAFHIQKGGVGKTTTSGNIGYSLSLQKKKTILIDCDPQGNLSSWFLTKAPANELADVLMKKIELENAIIELNDHLSIVPTFGIGGNLKQYAETKLVYEPIAFQKLSQGLEALGFEYAIFDLSPGMSLLEKTIIGAMDETISPITLEFFSYDGIEIFDHELKNIIENYGKNIIHKRIVLNNINHSFNQHNLRLDQIKKNSKYLLYTIAQDRQIADAQAENKSIFEFAPRSKVIPEYLRLAKDIIGA